MTQPNAASPHTIGHLHLALFALICALGFGATAAAQNSLELTCGRANKAERSLTAQSLFPTASAASVEHLSASAAGWDLGTLPSTFGRDTCASDKPFFLSAALPEGNYRVTVTLGGPQRSTTTVRAESRRLLLMQQVTTGGGTATRTFTLNVRTPVIAGQTAPDGAPPQVHLKPREVGALDWDRKLTLEFTGEHPSLRSVRIQPAPDVPTLYLAGDSTVVDQDKEPWAAWGQMLPLFFGPGLAISNQAESGETIRSFEGERRFAKIFSTIHTGDLLMLQFAHNDQKPGPGLVPAHTDFRDLLRKYIALSRSKGATPILVTSMNRRAFDDDGHIRPTLGDYPDVMREVAAEDHVALIDLNAASKTLFEAMGPEGTLRAFVHYPANSFPGQDKPLADDTHFNSYGAYELARIVVGSIRSQHLALARCLLPDLPGFDLAHPDDPAAFHLPPSPSIDLQTPYGR